MCGPSSEISTEWLIASFVRARNQGGGGGQRNSEARFRARWLKSRSQSGGAGSRGMAVVVSSFRLVRTLPCCRRPGPVAPRQAAG